MQGFVFAIQVFLRFRMCRCGRRGGMQGFVFAIQSFPRFWVYRCRWRGRMTVAVRDDLRMLAGDCGEDVVWLPVWLSFWLSSSQSRCLSCGQSDFESHDVVVHVEAVSDVEVALAEDAETEVMVEAYRRIVAVHVQFDTGTAPFNTPSCNFPHMSDRTGKQGSAESVALFRRKYIYLL